MVSMQALKTACVLKKKFSAAKFYSANTVDWK